MKYIILAVLFLSCAKEQVDYNEQSLKGGKKPPVVIPPTDTIPTYPTVVTLITPPIGDQGNEGSCVPYSTAYLLRAVDWYYKTGEMKAFSVEYVYNQTKFGDCNSGTALTSTLNLLKTKGVCLSSDMPEVDGNCSILPTAIQDSLAAAYKISGYAAILSTDSLAIKKALRENKAVAISILMDNSFINCPENFIWKIYSGSGSFPHTMTIIGYDDIRGAYKVQNCWGTSWGNQGFSYIDYKFFLTRTGYNVYVITS